MKTRLARCQKYRLMDYTGSGLKTAWCTVRDGRERYIKARGLGRLRFMAWDGEGRRRERERAEERVRWEKEIRRREGI